MTGAEMVERYERERDLLVLLLDRIKKELQLIAEDDVQGLEDSLPEKMKILREIQKIRADEGVLDEAPGEVLARRMRSLQQELVGLWKEASGLNDAAKRMVTGRLSEIDQTLCSFFDALKSGYARDGRKAGIPHHTLRTGA